MPVFSNSPEKGVGLVYFTGPTMGYLIGFLFAAFLSGYFDFKKIFFNISKTNIKCFNNLFTWNSLVGYNYRMG